MRRLRNIFIHCFLPLLFIWYISGISLFPHTHIVDGVTIVHSHPNPDAEHNSGEDFVTINMLSHFHSCGAEIGVQLPSIFQLLISEYDGIRDISLSVNKFYRYFGLRAPPFVQNCHLV